jgi:hypothetical protein
MLRRLVTSALIAGLLASPLSAQAPSSSPPSTPPPSTPPPAAAPAEARPEEPSVGERRIVAFAATGVAVASLAAGITMGVLAQAQFNCANDIRACNAGLTNKVVGEELFDVRAEIEQKALFADMAYLFAAAATVVATVGYLRGFVFVDEEPAPTASTAPHVSSSAVAFAAPQVQP